MADKRALLFTTIQGHASIADAISRKLTERGWHTLVAAFEDPVIVIYRWVYRYAPWLCRIYFNSLFLPGFTNFVAIYSKKSHRPIFKKAIVDFPTEIIIGTSYGFDSSVLSLRNELQKKGEVPPIFVNVVVDPRTFYATNVVADADLNCVFDEEVARRAKAFRPTAKVLATGWFVRSEFNSQTSKETIRKQLGLTADRLTFLFVAGSEGEVKSAHLIPKLLEGETPIQIILACGSNKQMRADFEPLVQKYAKDPDKKFVTLPFTKELYFYVRAADLLVGKAGPNSVFEAVACHTPFFATTHIAGQEDGNLEIIREYGIGFVEENLAKAQQLLEKIVNEPQKLNALQPAIKKLAKYNDQSIERLLSALEKLKKS